MVEPYSVLTTSLTSAEVRLGKRIRDSTYSFSLLRFSFSAFSLSVSVEHAYGENLLT